MAIVLSDDEKNDNRAVGRRRSSMFQPQSRMSDQDMFVLSSSAENQSTAAVSEKPSDDGDDDDVGSRYAPAAESCTSISSPTYAQHRRASRQSSVLPPLKPFSPFQHGDGEPMIRDDDDAASAAGVGDEDDKVLVRSRVIKVQYNFTLGDLLCCTNTNTDFTDFRK